MTRTTTKIVAEPGLATSVFLYNPIFQKRTGLGPDFPGGGGYSYWGPPPDAGTSYGSWSDPANGFGVISPVQQDSVALYSPASGEPMQYEGQASEDMRAAVSAFNGELHLLPASQTGQTCLTSVAIYHAEHECAALYNPFTGEEITEEYRKMKDTKKAAPTTAAKKQDMGPGMGSLPNSVEVPDLKASGLPKMDASKPVKHDKAGKMDSKTNSGGSSEKDTERSVKHSSIKPVGNDEVKVPKVSKAAKSVDQMSDDELLDAVEAHLSTADGETCPVPGEESHEGHEHEAPGMSFSEEGSEEPPPPPPMSSPEASEENMEMPPMSEPEIPVLSDEPVSDQSASEFLGANATLHKKLVSTAAALRAGVAVDEKELKVLMAKASAIIRRANGSPARASTPNASEMSKQISDLTSAVAKLTQFVQALPVAQPPVGQPPMAKPGLPGEMKADEEMSKPASDEQSAPPASEPAPESAPAPVSPAPPEESLDKQVEDVMQEPDDDEAAGVHFEVLQSLDQLEQEGITAASVSCHLYGAGSGNPFWNIHANGEPLARIFLQDQERPEEIKALFVSPQYGEAIAKASEQVKGGLRQVLADARARYFALNVDKIDIAKRAQAAATAKADKVVAEKLATIQDRFLECMATAAIGMDRNFFSEGNALKDAFFQTLAQHGIQTRQAVRVIESSFSDGSAAYFKALAKKATELMSMEPQAFNQLRKSILEAGTIAPVVAAVEDSIEQGPTMGQILTEASVIVQANGAAEQVDEKTQLKRDLGFAK